MYFLIGFVAGFLVIPIVMAFLMALMVTADNTHPSVYKKPDGYTLDPEKDKELIHKFNKFS